MGTAFAGLSLSGGKYVTAAHHARLDFADDAFSINARFKGSAAGPIANKYDSVTAKGWQLLAVAGGNARLTVNGTSISGGSILDDAWHDLLAERDSNRDLLRLFVDGVEITPVAFTAATCTNSAAFQVGRTPDGTSMLTGSVAEVRLSRGLRTVEDFQVPFTQFEDDGDTRLLWHFNEGKGSTVFDMSADAIDEYDRGVRQNGTITGGSGSGTWVYGPLMANPARIIHESVWYALDVDTNLRDYATQFKLRRHRGRATDKSTARILEAKAIPQQDFPGFFALPQRVSGVPPHTNAYDKAMVPLMFMGGVLSPSAMSGLDLWWLTLRAILRQETTDAGHFFHTRIQNWLIRAVTPEAIGLASGSIASTFITQIDFEVNCDLRTSGTP